MSKPEETFKILIQMEAYMNRIDEIRKRDFQAEMPVPLCLVKDHDALFGSVSRKRCALQEAESLLEKQKSRTHCNICHTCWITGFCSRQSGKVPLGSHFAKTFHEMHGILDASSKVFV